jgi:anti-anti-sigma regulatory factor
MPYARARIYDGVRRVLAATGVTSASSSCLSQLLAACEQLRLQRLDPACPGSG